MSLGGNYQSRAVQTAIDYAWGKGAVLTCAAGNDFRSRPKYPAAYTNCIAVAATDHNDAKATFSNYGSNWVDIAAPGKAILSTAPNHPNTTWGTSTVTNPYALLDGTSTATPHVAGVAGLVWAVGLCSTNTCVRSRIEHNADAIPGTGSYWQWGRLNAYRSLTAP